MDDVLREFVTEALETVENVDRELVRFEQEPNDVKRARTARGSESARISSSGVTSREASTSVTSSTLPPSTATAAA